MIYGMDVNQALEFAKSKLASDDSGDMVQGFRVLCEVYKETKDRNVLDTIIEFYKVADRDASLPLRADTVSRIALSKNLSEQFSSFQDSLSNEDSLLVRSILTGKTIEQLRQADEEAAKIAEAKRKQAEEWRSQGLCQYCGGQLGMFKKCKSCGRKQTKADSVDNSKGLVCGTELTQLLEQPGTISVLVSDGPMPETVQQINSFRQDGITDVTVVLDTRGVDNTSLIEVVEMEMRELLESTGYTDAHTVVVRR